MLKKALTKQKGNILVMFTLALFALFGMAALALDGGHLLLNKNRLQNIVDAAALSGAKELDLGNDHFEAITAVKEMITLNLSHSGYGELDSVIDLDSHLTIQFGPRPQPFNPILTPGIDEENNRYIKVTISNLPLVNFLAQVLGFNKKVSATALAGPSTVIASCYSDLVPMMVCARGPEDDGFFGYDIGEITVMKIGSTVPSEVGSGNFQLLNLPGNQGGNDIRNAMAGATFDGVEACFTTSEDDSLTTAPGNKVGPSLQGLNTRLGTSKLDGYESDTDTCQHGRLDIEKHTGTIINEDDLPIYSDGTVIDDGILIPEGDIIPSRIANLYRHSHYDPSIYVRDGITIPPLPSGECVKGDNPVAGVDERRVINVIIAQCDGGTNGSKPPFYEGSGCFFLTQDIENGGQDSFVVGEFIEDCTVEGVASDINEDNPGPYTIVLYHVPFSKDS
ncbi:Tad domain-containing protein [Thalassotalea crassostreae]|uniref:Tad domain-containing protein n=1 Tax=Thalassotalea crassostreae TaxID=1763536 RepID=UPI0008394565|nr:Tad domain-containing protein [Thalassotalea crassostreae]